MNFLIAALWVLPAFLLHNIIHEGAHALFALASGAKNVKLWPFPGWRLGYFTWAHMTYDGTASVATNIAPVLAETVWFAGFATLFFIFPHPIFAVECAASLVDMTVWFLGFWRPTENQACDAAKTRIGWNFERTVGRAISMAWMLPLFVIAIGLARLKW